MDQYLNLLEEIAGYGYYQNNRTGIPTHTIPGAMFSLDMGDGFPLITTKKMATRAIIGELIGFLRGYSDSARFKGLGCGIWDANANSPGKNGNPWLNSPYRKGTDDLGRIYGVQWRNRRDIKLARSFEEASHLADSGYRCVGHHELTVPWGGVYYREFDQIADAITQIRTNPTNRRIIVDAWNPAEFDEMALPPCHVKYQFLVNTEDDELNLCMYQRSCDEFLGVPFNIASASLFLHVMARITGLTPRFFTHFMADAHLYDNSLDAVAEQCSRESKELCHLEIDSSRWITELDGDGRADSIFESIRPEDFRFLDYDCHEAITGVKMAV